MANLLQKLLYRTEIEYLKIDSNLIITEMSSGINKFSNSTATIKKGEDIRNYFPELVGMEEILTKIINEETTDFALNGVAKFENDDIPLYLDIYVCRDFDQKRGESLLIILFEDVTEKMVLKQSLTQIINEKTLLFRALEISKNYLDTILKSISDSLIITDSSGYIKILNKSTQNLFGYKESELINQPFSLIIKDEKFSQIIDQHLQNLGKGEVLKDLELECQTKTGNIILIEFSLSIIQTEIKSQKDFVYIGRDITEQKRAALEIAKALVKEREINELKSRLMSIASHEFRTPLTVISSSVGIIKDFGARLSEEKKKQHLERIQTYIKYTNQLLDDVLLMNKVEAGKLTLESIPVNITELCQTIVEELQEISPKHTLAFSVSLASNFLLDESHHFVCIDKKILRQILINLLSNAIKYSPRGGMVHLDLMVDELAMVLTIDDEGIGIPPEDQKQLFSPFCRAGNVGEIHGTGLGLSIVKKCVELYAGDIEVRSQLDVGTTFKVIIPLNR